jgi:hypothetical protein
MALPAESFGPWTRVWSQFRRWSRNGTSARALTVLHTAAARDADGREEATPSMVVIDTHLARGASTVGPRSTTKAGRMAAPTAPSGGRGRRDRSSRRGADGTRLDARERRQRPDARAPGVAGFAGRLELVLVDRGVSTSEEGAPSEGYGQPSAAWCVEHIDPRHPGEGSFQVDAFTTETEAGKPLRRLETEGFFAELHINVVPIHHRIRDREWDR